jgi:hypothetical protein
MSEQDIRQTHLTPDEVEAVAETSASLPEARRAHARSCAACAREVAELRRLSAALARLPLREPAPGFGDRVMARVRLPVPWHRRLAASVRERTAAGIAVAATIGALLAGTGLWALRFPHLSPNALAGWLAGQAGELLWQGAMTAGRVAYAMGVTDLAGLLQAELSLASAFAAVATISLVGVGALSVMIRLVRTEPRGLMRAR